MAGEDRVSVSFQIAYEGEPDAHSMDVQVLAPAMLALGDLVREANTLLNGNRATVQLSVNADFQHKCFQIDFELVQTIYEQVKSLLSDDGVRSAKELLEWLDLITGGTPGRAIGLFAFLQWLRGRKVKSVTALESSDHRGTVVITVGEGATVDKIEVNQNVYKLAESPKIRRSVPQVLAPLETVEYDRMEVRTGATKRVISQEEARDIDRSCVAEDALDQPVSSPQTITAHLEIFGPVFDTAAENWRFKFDGNPIFVDITATNIAADAIARGGSFIGDTYKVRMEIQERRTPLGRFRNHYKILEVLEFYPASLEPTQASLFDEENE